MIEGSCHSCGWNYNVSDDKVGKRLKCRECQAIVDIPFDDDPDFDEYDDDYAAPVRRRPAQRPRRRKSRSSRKSGSTAGVIVAAVGGGIMVVAGIVVGIVFAVNSGSKGDEVQIREPDRSFAGGGGTNYGGNSGLGGRRRPPQKSPAYAQYDRFYGDFKKANDDFFAIMATVRDPQTARLAASRIDGISARLEAMARRGRSLPSISFSEKSELKRKYANIGGGYSAGLAAGRRARLASRGEPTFRAAVLRVGRAMTPLQRYLQ